MSPSGTLNLVWSFKKQRVCNGFQEFNCFFISSEFKTIDAYAEDRVGNARSLYDNVEPDMRTAAVETAAERQRVQVMTSYVVTKKTPHLKYMNAQPIGLYVSLTRTGNSFISKEGIGFKAT